MEVIDDIRTAGVSELGMLTEKRDSEDTVQK
jgi:hypothetical protein